MSLWQRKTLFTLLLVVVGVLGCSSADTPTSLTLPITEDRLLTLVSISTDDDESGSKEGSNISAGGSGDKEPLKHPFRITRLLNKQANSNSTDEAEDQVILDFGSRWHFQLPDFNSSKDTSRIGRLMKDGIFSQGESLGSNNSSSGEVEKDYVVIPKKFLKDTLDFASEKWIQRQRNIDNVFITNKGADSQSPIGTAFAFNPPNLEALGLANTSVLLELASLSLLESLGSVDKGSQRVKREAFSVMDESVIPLERSDDTVGILVASRRQGQMSVMQCGVHDQVLPCDSNNRYRTYSGWCNNVRNPGWGKSVITFDRMIPSAYSDGVSRPRSNSVTGVLLPSPRHVSRYVHVDVSHLSNRHTLMLMQFAQFLDHDLTLTPVHKGPQDKILNCRDCESQLRTHPECWPISVPEGDSWYPVKHQETGRPSCIPFTRSLPGQQRLGPREQINQNSAYIDASQIYGENVCKAESLRIIGGKLNSTNHPSFGRKPLMPQTGTLRECKSPSGYCFYAGDPRASEQPALASVHTIFMRQHNEWADGLKRLNPHWNDEKIYQEGRRIMGAVNQHITYNELLPRILGPSMVNAYGLGLQSEGYYAGYDSKCPANVYNEFSTAAFRFGHSLIRPNLARMDGKYHGMNPHLQLRDGFFNSDMMYKPLMVDEIIRGLLAEPMEQLDPFVTNEITNHLFEDKKKPFSGLDLISLNIHRARDHGLPGYNSYRSVCSLNKAKTFTDLSTEIPEDVLLRLQKVYAHVDDIDLFTGALVEQPVKGGILGPVMTCIIGTQFKRIRACDRFWYETNDAVLRFTPQQLAEIRKVTLSKIACDNMDIPTDTQKHAMDAPHNILNPRVPCDRLPALNIEAWRDSPTILPSLSIPSAQAHTAPATPGCFIGGKQVGVGGAALQSPCVSCVCTPQGTKCASLRITSCEKLMADKLRVDILRDPVCTSQCGLFLGQKVSTKPFVNRLQVNQPSRFVG